MNICAVKIVHRSPPPLARTLRVLAARRAKQTIIRKRDEIREMLDSDIPPEQW